MIYANRVNKYKNRSAPLFTHTDTPSPMFSSIFESKECRIYGLPGEGVLILFVAQFRPWFVFCSTELLLQQALLLQEYTKATVMYTTICSSVKTSLQDVLGIQLMVGLKNLRHRQELKIVLLKPFRMRGACNICL